MWALGNGGTGGKWTNGHADYPSNQRLLDPECTGGAGGNLSLPFDSAKAAARRAWAALSGANRTVVMVEQWHTLYEGVGTGFLLQPLAGISCENVDCIGTVVSTEDCVC